MKKITNEEFKSIIGKSKENLAERIIKEMDSYKDDIQSGDVALEKIVVSASIAALNTSNRTLYNVLLELDLVED